MFLYLNVKFHAAIKFNIHRQEKKQHVITIAVKVKQKKIWFASIAKTEMKIFIDFHAPNGWHRIEIDFFFH